MEIHSFYKGRVPFKRVSKFMDTNGVTIKCVKLHENLNDTIMYLFSNK